MDDRRRSGPETTWGFVRALLQAVAGVAYLLEDHPSIGGFLLAVAAATAIYESAAWWRHRARRPRRGGASSAAVRSGWWAPVRARSPFRT